MVASSGGSQLDWLEPATPRRLRQALRDGSYHVLHYVGHSDFTADGEGVIYLEDADGGAGARSTRRCSPTCCRTRTSLRLVVLNSCEGARTTLTDPYAGVATTLVQLGVPAVVAMQFEISDRAAIVFAEELYTNLIGRQDPIDAAVAEARKAIYSEVDEVEWATPVLFVRDPDVELFRFGPAAPAAAAAAAGRRRARRSSTGRPRRRAGGRGRRSSRRAASRRSPSSRRAGADPCCDDDAPARRPSDRRRARGRRRRPRTGFDAVQVLSPTATSTC